MSDSISIDEPVISKLIPLSLIEFYCFKFIDSEAPCIDYYPVTDSLYLEIYTI